MATEAIVRIGVTFLSLFTTDALRRFSRRHQPASGDGEDCSTENENWTGSKENNKATLPLLSETTKPSTYNGVDCLPLESSRRTFPQSFLKSLTQSFVMSFTLTILLVPVTMFLILVLYIDLNTSNLCFEHVRRGQDMRRVIVQWWLLGHAFEAVALNFWFQLNLILLLGLRKFVTENSATILLGLIVGSTVAVCKTVLFTQYVDFTKTEYRYFGNVLFLLGVVCTGYLVARNICRRDLTLGKCKVLAILATQFFIGFIIAMVYRYAILPWFNKTENEIGKAVIAMIMPILIIIPMVICENLALKSVAFANQSRSFLLVYFVNGVSIILYYIMQAGFASILVFTLLSLFRAFLQVFQVATEKIRNTLLTRFWEYVGEVCCLYSRLVELIPDTVQYERLKIDKDIQAMFDQNTALVLSQAYLTLYLITNFDVDLWNVLSDLILVRISIGLGVNTLANFVSTLIHIHYHCTSHYRVWVKNMHIYVLANAVIGAMTILYFTSVLLTVFHVFPISGRSVALKNCTAPF